ncbi:hypothetical protein ABPG74_009488 [Tetrahymena malaccensis]
MSITASNCYEISNSPLNLSKSKQLYSFPKDKRFRDSSAKMCDSFYDLPSTKDHRSTSFGYGKKSDLSGLSASPAPNKYNIAGEFENSKEKHRGYSLGLGRNNINFGSMFNPKSEGNKPGPGTYKVNSTLSNISFSMRAKTPGQDEKNTNRKDCPGPGTYTNPLSMSANGKYPHSKYKNTGLAFISPQTVVKDFNSSAHKSSLPGPGQYNPPSTITQTGKQVVYRFKSSGACTFPHSGRDELGKATGIPGPGYYRLPSEFGYYESKNPQQDKSYTSPQKNTKA